MRALVRKNPARSFGRVRRDGGALCMYLIVGLLVVVWHCCMWSTSPAQIGGGDDAGHVGGIRG